MEIEELTTNELIIYKKVIRLELIKRNITSLDEFELRNKHKCLDCDNIIGRKAKRCWDCSIKNRDNSKARDNLKVFHNEEHPRWKGDKVGYSALHDWIRRNKSKPTLCEDCNKVPPFDVANISGKYKRDITDYEWLCRKCHFNKDRKNIKRDVKGRIIKNED